MINDKSVLVPSHTKKADCALQQPIGNVGGNTSAKSNTMPTTFNIIYFLRPAPTHIFIIAVIILYNSTFRYTQIYAMVNMKSRYIFYIQLPQCSYNLTTASHIRQRYTYPINVNQPNIFNISEHNIVSLSTIKM